MPLQLLAGRLHRARETLVHEGNLVNELCSCVDLLRPPPKCDIRLASGFVAAGSCPASNGIAQYTHIILALRQDDAYPHSHEKPERDRIRPLFSSFGPFGLTVPGLLPRTSLEHVLIDITVRSYL